MAIKIVRLGSPRQAGEGLRVGTVRRPPRGVRKQDYAAKDIYDVWFPNLAPSETLLKEARAAQDEKSWKMFRRKFLTEMKKPEASKDLDLLAALSHHTNFALGCYCEDESRCHRSILKELLLQRGAEIRQDSVAETKFARAAWQAAVLFCDWPIFKGANKREPVLPFLIFSVIIIGGLGWLIPVMYNWIVG